MHSVHRWQPFHVSPAMLQTKQRCKHFSGYSTPAVLSYSHSLRVAYDKSAVIPIGRWEWRYSCQCETLRAHLEMRRSARVHIKTICDTRFSLPIVWLLSDSELLDGDVKVCLIPLQIVYLAYMSMQDSGSEPFGSHTFWRLLLPIVTFTKNVHSILFRWWTETLSNTNLYRCVEIRGRRHSCRMAWDEYVASCCRMAWNEHIASYYVMVWNTHSSRMTWNEHVANCYGMVWNKHKALEWRGMNT